MIPFKKKSNGVLMNAAVITILLCLSKSCLSRFQERKEINDSCILTNRQSCPSKDIARQPPLASRQETIAISTHTRDVRADSRQSRIDANDIRTDFREIRSELSQFRSQDLNNNDRRSGEFKMDREHHDYLGERTQRFGNLENYSQRTQQCQYTTVSRNRDHNEKILGEKLAYRRSCWTRNDEKLDRAHESTSNDNTIRQHAYRRNYFQQRTRYNRGYLQDRTFDRRSTDRHDGVIEKRAIRERSVQERSVFKNNLSNRRYMDQPNISREHTRHERRYSKNNPSERRNTNLKHSQERFSRKNSRESVTNTRSTSIRYVRPEPQIRERSVEQRYNLADKLSNPHHANQPGIYREHTKREQIVLQDNPSERNAERLHSLERFSSEDSRERSEQQRRSWRNNPSSHRHIDQIGISQEQPSERRNAAAEHFRDRFSRRDSREHIDNRISVSRRNVRERQFHELSEQDRRASVDIYSIRLHVNQPHKYEEQAEYERNVFQTNPSEQPYAEVDYSRDFRGQINNRRSVNPQYFRHSKYRHGLADNASLRRHMDKPNISRDRIENEQRVLHDDPSRHINIQEEHIRKRSTRKNSRETVDNRIYLSERNVREQIRDHSIDRHALADNSLIRRHVNQPDILRKRTDHERRDLKDNSSEHRNAELENTRERINNRRSIIQREIREEPNFERSVDHRRVLTDNLSSPSDRHADQIFVSRESVEHERRTLENKYSEQRNTKLDHLWEPFSKKDYRERRKRSLIQRDIRGQIRDHLSGRHHIEFKDSREHFTKEDSAKLDRRKYVREDLQIENHSIQQRRALADNPSSRQHTDKSHISLERAEAERRALNNKLSERRTNERDISAGQIRERSIQQRRLLVNEQPRKFREQQPDRHINQKLYNREHAIRQDFREYSAKNNERRDGSEQNQQTDSQKVSVYQRRALQDTPSSRRHMDQSHISLERDEPERRTLNNELIERRTIERDIPAEQICEHPVQQRRLLVREEQRTFREHPDRRINQKFYSREDIIRQDSREHSGKNNERLEGEQNQQTGYRIDQDRDTLVRFFTTRSLTFTGDHSTTRNKMPRKVIYDESSTRSVLTDSFLHKTLDNDIEFIPGFKEKSNTMLNTIQTIVVLAFIGQIMLNNSKKKFGSFDWQSNWIKEKIF